MFTAAFAKKKKKKSKKWKEPKCPSTDKWIRKM